MSRHEFDIGGYSVSVGYDAALRTYFGYIEQKDDDDGQPLVRLGDNGRTFPDYREFLSAFTTAAISAGVEGFAIPPEIQNALENDFASPGLDDSAPVFG